MSLKLKQNAYKGFFEQNEHGIELYERMQLILKQNRDRADDTSSITFLDRSKGNREIIELIDNVIRSEVKTK